MISHIESGRSGLVRDGLVKAAQVLDVSVDYLLGLTDDPAPVDDRVHEAEERAREAEARIRREEARNREQMGAALERMRAHAQSTEVELEELRAAHEFSGPQALAEERAPGARPVDVRELDAAAGTGATDLDETVAGRLWFQRDWLDRHGLDATQCVIIGVHGDSMEPTLPRGCSILVNRTGRRRRVGRVYVLRTDTGLIVKRLAKDDAGRWLMLSDSSDQKRHPPRSWTAETKIIGDVRWQGKTL